MTRLFLSYARDDDEPFVSRLHKDLTTRGFDVWFDRASMPSRNLTFHQEIRDAVAECDRVLLVVGPNAVISDYVRQEWQFAYFEADKVVTPVLRSGDYPIDIDDLKLIHCEDFRNDDEYDLHLEQLVRILNEPPPKLGKLIAVPSLPAHFLSRSKDLAKIRDSIRADLDNPVVASGPASRIGLHGMGGIGKSVLAAALARDRKVREAFPDGILWVGLGTDPDIRERMEELHRALGGDGLIATEHEGEKRLKEILSDQSVLLVIDDAWRRSHVDAFDVLGPKCRALVTTRDMQLLTSLGGVNHVVEFLTEAEAMRLIAASAGLEVGSLPPEAASVLAECGRLPLAVALAGGMVQAGTPWEDLLEALQEHDLEFLEDSQATNEQHVNLWRTIEVSVYTLSSDVQERLAELAVFPPGESIPGPAVTTLWKHTGNLSPRHTRKLLVELKQRSLVQLGRRDADKDGTALPMTLHDLIFDYCSRLSQKIVGDKTTLHTKLLDAYTSLCPGGWWDAPNDGYILENLRGHLIAAKKADDLVDILQELRWLERKSTAGLVFDLLRDYRCAIDALAEEDDLHRMLNMLRTAISRDVEFIARYADSYPQGLFQCLWNSCWWHDCPDAKSKTAGASSSESSSGVDSYALFRLLEKWRADRETIYPGFLWFRNLFPPVVPLNSKLLASLKFSPGTRSIAFAADGQSIGAIGYSRPDKCCFVETKQVSTGETTRSFKVPAKTFGCLEFSPCGLLVALYFGDDDKNTWASELDKSDDDACAEASSIYLLNTQTGIVETVLHGHSDPVSCISFSPDGRYLVSGSFDNSIRLWDVKRGIEISSFVGHSDAIRCIEYSPDRKLFVSGSEDSTVRIWDIDSGAATVAYERPSARIVALAFSEGGSQISAVWSDRALIVWDVNSQSILETITMEELGGDRSVVTAKFSHDRHSILVLTMSRMQRGGTFWIWDQAGIDEESVYSRIGDGWISSDYSPDGSKAVIRSGTGHQVWCAHHEPSLESPSDQRRAMVIAASARRDLVATASEEQSLGTFALKIWKADTQRLLKNYSGHWFPIASLDINSARPLIAFCFAYTIRLIDLDSDEENLILAGHSEPVSSLKFSPKGSYLASTDVDGVMKVWEMCDRICVFDICDIADQKAFAFDPDEERVAVVSAQKSIQIWDVQNQCLLEELQGISEHADHIWFSGCGQHVLFESWDNGLGCWNIASGEVIENLTFLHVVDFWRSRRVFWDTEREKELLLSEVGIPESANMLIQPTSSRGSTDFSPVNRLGLRSGDAVRGDYLAMPHPEFSVIYPSSRENEWIGLSDGHLQITRLEGEIDRIG